MQPLIIDNFAGGGGASTGLEAAFGRPVDVAINHDEAAIAVHAANHPATRHYCQSIYSVDPLDATGGQKVLGAWFSPDCKHHSKAKGGKPREKYIRDMAWVVPHWIERLKKATEGGEGAPVAIWLENVEEFRNWGPLDDKGKPIPERKGEEFDLWVRRIRRLGYKVEFRELVAADYGAPTTRKRLFLVARRDGRPIEWPEPTHAPADPDARQRWLRRQRENGFKVADPAALQTWRAAADCIDWSIPCPSIFDRKAPLKPATCRRIAAGVMRYVVESAQPFIVPVTHTHGGNVAQPIDEPLRTITTAKGGEFAVTAPLFARTAHGEVDASGKRRGRGSHGPGEPFPTVTAKQDSALTAANLIRLRNNSLPRDPRAPLDTITAGGKHHAVTATTLVQTGYGEREGQAPRALDIRQPLGTVVAGGAKHAKVAAFMAQHNAGNGAAPRDLREPVSTVTGRGTQQQPVEVTLVEEGALPPAMLERAVEVAAFLVKYYGAEQGQHQAVDVPLDTITAKPRFAVVTVTIDAATYVLVDIGMRMLTPRELANAQGFPASYVLDPECWYLTEKGNRKFGRLPKTHQIAKIGNSVCPVMSEVLARATFPEHCSASGDPRMNESEVA